jgi:Do/DeqQ family serine protease
MTTSVNRSGGRHWAQVKLGAATVAVLFASMLAGSSLHGPAARAGGPTAAVAGQAPPSSVPAASYADLVSRVAPSVVTVRSERMVKPAGVPFGDDPFFRQFFGDRLPEGPMPPRREGGLGSGVVVTADGYILTNHHVVDGAEHIKVELSDKRVFPARLVGSDAPSDLAVLKVAASGLPALQVGDSDAVRVGDVVLAFGNPLGVGQTVTMGIISAKGRATDLGNGSFEDFLQTDAPINQGNSGGALVNTRGELVGINSQIVTPSGGNIGIGFAIPASMARNVMAQLLKDGKVHRGQLGLMVQDVTAEIAKSLSLREVKGALAGDVKPGSAAARAGIERGDVIVAFDGVPVEDANSLRNRVAATAPGSKVTLTVLRNHQERTLTARLGELEPTRTAGSDAAGGSERGKLGLSLKPLSPAEARELGAEGAKGLLVAEVDPDGPAAASGFQAGDVIEQVNGRPVAAVSDLKDATKDATDARPALVLVRRKGASLFLTLAPERA